MRIANRAIRQLIADHRFHQALGGDLVGGFVGVEGEGQHQLAIAHHLAHGGGVLHKLFARTPQVWVQRIQIHPQRRACFGQGFRRDLFVQCSAICVDFNQRLFDERHAVEIGRAWVRDTAWVRFRKIQQRGHALGRCGHLLAVGEEGQLRHAPRRLKAFHKL